MELHRDYKGRCVQCVFMYGNKEVLHYGYIIKLGIRNGEWFFTVKYDDGDFYDYTKEEIDNIVVNKWKFNNAWFDVNSSARLPVGDEAVLFVEWYDNSQVIQEWITYKFDQLMYILKGDEIRRFLDYLKYCNYYRFQCDKSLTTKYNMLSITMASKYIQ